MASGHNTCLPQGTTHFGHRVDAASSPCMSLTGFLHRRIANQATSQQLDLLGCLGPFCPDPSFPPGSPTALNSLRVALGAEPIAIIESASDRPPFSAVERLLLYRASAFWGLRDPRPGGVPTTGDPPVAAARKPDLPPSELLR
ncbi:MAG: hypothetical protein FRX49_07462 [Trebouxia sp. A1-2]|nr:MAG: hypothetical protein FRX49_07462 [Trebouxia sp. A1-2]